MATKLPKWLTRQANGVFIVDPDAAYPLALKALGVEIKDVDQYWLEVAFQCSKLAVQELVLGSDLDPRPKSALVIIVDTKDGQKDRWRLANFKPGKGITAATKGLEAKQIHYPKIARAMLAAA